MQRSNRRWVSVLMVVLALLLLATLASSCRARRRTRTPTPTSTPTSLSTRSPDVVPRVSPAVPESKPTETPEPSPAVPPPTVPVVAECTTGADTVLAQDAIAPYVIEWESACLPDADLAYIDNNTWEIWVMNEQGGNKRCLTCFGDNALGVDFPLENQVQGAVKYRKGGVEAHPSMPIFFFHAENANSERTRANAPSIGWDNDLWAINLEPNGCAPRYSQLTALPPDAGLQHTALSNDGQWYVYPLRYRAGIAPLNFGLSRLVFSEVIVEATGDVRLATRFEVEPNGRMYYEPNDVQANGAGGYSLIYVASATALMDPYRYNWQCQGDSCSGDNTRLMDTPEQHEEFGMFSPSGQRIVWMAGSQVGLAYQTDLYISAPDFSGAQRLTWYNDCTAWSERCAPNGVQFSRLNWSRDGHALYYGLWTHAGPLRPFQKTELHRLELVGNCGS